MTDFESPSIRQSSRPWLRAPLVGTWKEIVIVTSLTAGLPILHSTWDGLHGSASHFVEILLTDLNLLLTMTCEAALLGTLLIFLHRRGWQPADLAIKMSWSGTGLGIGLWIAVVVAGAASVLTFLGLAFEIKGGHDTFLHYLIAHSPQIKPHSISVAWLTIFSSMILNAYVEEIIFMSYIFRQLAARCGPAMALLVTIILRAGCHVYQDTAHVAGIAVIFTIFALVYLRFRSIWPLILAHILMDIGSTGLVKLIHGV